MIRDTSSQIYNLDLYAQRYDVVYVFHTNAGVLEKISISSNPWEISLQYRNLEEMNEKLLGCVQCERLAKFRVEVAGRNSKFKNEKFWSRPVPGYGDIDGRILILGLAPAATGGNRTGRVFTGDKSSDFLVSCLHEVGITNIPTSISREDGLEYNDSYITAVLKCVPPNDKPVKDEINNCRGYLEYEIDSMPNLKVVVTLGTVAHNGFNTYLRSKGYDVRGKKFGHGVVHDYGSFKEICCYHPSPRNVNTGRLTREQFVEVMRMVKEESVKG